MDNVVAVFGGVGDLLTIIKADTKQQLSIALNDFADEYDDGCSLQGSITDRDWSTLSSAYEGSCISILCEISNGKLLEIKGFPMRDYTHLQEEK